MSRPDAIGVVGAGTMGAGIAQLACQAGCRTLLWDPDPAALRSGVERVRAGLEKAASRGVISEASGPFGLLEQPETSTGLGECDLVIEAAPESAELKARLFAELSGIVAEDCVLATNTSSLPVTAVAAAATHPERVVGMHFFNPAPAMKLVEVIAGELTGERAVEVARATGEAMGKRVIPAADGPGFLVNRCGRPFGLESLRVVQERLASVEQVDRICRMAAGFRMGPFELMDLVGVDTGYDVQRSFWELSFGEPRWRPSPITARMVAAGRHGRKAGAGYYDYPPGRPADPEPPAPGGGGEGPIVVAGELPIAEEIQAAARQAGWPVADAPSDEPPWLIVDCDPAEADPLDARTDAAAELGPPAATLQGGPLAVLCAEGSLAALDPAGTAAGFHALAPFEAARLVELTRTPTTSDLAAQRAERFFATLGKHPEWVGDAPGLVLGRVVCQLVNEAAFALREGVGSPEDVDAGMRLGLNHPRGPLEWADAIGLDHVLAVLDALWEETREERYRACPDLRARVWDGRLGTRTGAGFFDH
ncbi:MAG TPA: 3-hydroxyacyl-CoA dehydrogenase NAD-binding domain-containing protein [Solirubrobacteraceae bacterium]|nr:3-hydroxyacyl-CoA dehydrogenase NAD-binding domain-containing protein [Solirubrobacteraceae bacterium]